MKKIFSILLSALCAFANQPDALAEYLYKIDRGQKYLDLKQFLDTRFEPNLESRKKIAFSYSKILEQLKAANFEVTEAALPGSMEECRQKHQTEKAFEACMDEKFEVVVEKEKQEIQANAERCAKFRSESKNAKAKEPDYCESPQLAQFAIIRRLGKKLNPSDRCHEQTQSDEEYTRCMEKSDVNTVDGQAKYQGQTDDGQAAPGEPTSPAKKVGESREGG